MDPHDDLLFWLARVARQARRAGDKKRAHYAVAADIDPTALTRFELGRAWPRDPDRIVRGYAEVLGLEAPVLWRRALELWEAHRAGRLELSGDDEVDLELVEAALAEFAAEGLAEPLDGSARPSSRRARQAGRRDAAALHIRSAETR